MAKTYWEQLSTMVVGASIGTQIPQVVDKSYIHPAVRDVYISILDTVGQGGKPTINNLILKGQDKGRLNDILENAGDNLDELLGKLPEAAGNVKLTHLVQNDILDIVSGEGEVPDKLSKVYEILNGFEGSVVAPSLVSASETIDEFYQYTQGIQDGSIPLIELPQDWGTISESAVLSPGDVLMAKGYTGDGKTMLLLQLAMYWASLGYCVIYITAETTKTAIGGRMIAGITGIGSTKLKKEGVSPWAFRYAKNKIESYSGEILFGSAYAPDIHQVISMLRLGMFQAQSKGMFPMFIVDYLQRVPGEGEKEYQRYADSLAKIKAFTLSTENFLGIATVTAIGSQVNADGQAFGSRQVEQYVQVVLDIEKRPEATGDSKAMKDGKQIVVCPNCGPAIQTTYQRNSERTVCKQCKTPVVKLFYHRAGARSAFTKLSLSKNNESDTPEQLVLISWFNLPHAFTSRGKPVETK